MPISIKEDFKGSVYNVLALSVVNSLFCSGISFGKILMSWVCMHGFM